MIWFSKIIPGFCGFIFFGFSKYILLGYHWLGLVKYISKIYINVDCRWKIYINWYVWYIFYISIHSYAPESVAAALRCLSESRPTTSSVVRTDSNRPAPSPSSWGRSNCASRQLPRREILNAVASRQHFPTEVLQNLSRGALYKLLQFRKKVTEIRLWGFTSVWPLFSTFP